MPDACLTPEEVAARLKVLPKTVRKWLREGQLPGVKVGRQWRVAESTLDRLIRGEIAFGTAREQLPDATEPPSGEATVTVDEGSAR